MLIFIFSVFMNLFFEFIYKVMYHESLFINFDKILLNFVFFMKLFSIILINNLMILTTSPNNIAYSVESLLKPLNFFNINPKNISLIIIITLRFIPVLQEEFVKIYDSQRSRGVNFQEKNLIKKLNKYCLLVMPVFILSMRKADELAEALILRGYDVNNSHTNYFLFKFNKNDVLVLIVITLLICGVLSCEILIKV